MTKLLYLALFFGTLFSSLSSEVGAPDIPISEEIALVHGVPVSIDNNTTLELIYVLDERQVPNKQSKLYFGLKIKRIDEEALIEISPESFTAWKTYHFKYMSSYSSTLRIKISMINDK